MGIEGSGRVKNQPDVTPANTGGSQTQENVKSKNTLGLKHVFVGGLAAVTGGASLVVGGLSSVALAAGAVAGPIFTTMGAALAAEAILGTLVLLPTYMAPVMLVLGPPMVAVGLTVVALGVATVALPLLLVSVASAAFVIAAIITLSLAARATSESKQAAQDSLPA